MITESNLIYDRESIKDFFYLMLPELKESEVMLMFAVGRKKYDPTLHMSSQILLRREIVRRTNMDYIMNKIDKIDATLHLAIERGKSVPLESMVIYFDLNPRNFLKAYNKFTREINNSVYDAMANPKADREVFKKIDVQLFAALHSIHSKKPYLLLDLDTKNEEIFKEVKNSMDFKWITETRGGYHLIARKTPENSAIAYQDLRLRIKQLEVHSHCQTPIPGILQGGFKTG